MSALNGGLRRTVLALGWAVLLLAAPAVVRAAEGHVSWGYDCAAGPPFLWGRLSPQFARCDDGTAQSPIDVATSGAVRRPLDPPVPRYGTTDLTVANNGHSVQADVPAGAGELRVGDASYRLVQFHWHTPSEHWIDGKRYPMELHLVHRGDRGLLVVGALVVEGRANPEVEKIWRSFPEKPGDRVKVAAFDLSKLLPGDLHSYRYRGSLTTPACDEGVQWIVLAQPVEMSREQIERFRSVFFGTERFPVGNARPVQPLGDRTVTTDVEP